MYSPIESKECNMSRGKEQRFHGDKPAVRPPNLPAHYEEANEEDASVNGVGNLKGRQTTENFYWIVCHFVEFD